MDMGVVMKFTQVKKPLYGIGLALFSTVVIAGPKAEVYVSVKNDTSPPLIELINAQQPPATIIDTRTEVFNVIDEPGKTPVLDASSAPDNELRQTQQLGASAPPVLTSFDGFTQVDNVALGGGGALRPPDTNGDVGINEYIAYINVGWKVFSKANGATLAGPFLGNTFWAGFGGPCETNNTGDPIVLYDKFADRWFFSQFTSSANPDGRQCVAISTTGDPLGPYNRYEFLFPGLFNDYPKVGIWVDEGNSRSGYYLTTHDFFDVGGPNQAFVQASFSVMERDTMLTGQPARFVRFTDTDSPSGNAFGALPPHIDSATPAPAGMCAPFTHNESGENSYLIWDFCVDWTDPQNLSSLSQPRFLPASAPYEPIFDNVAQPNGAPALDEFGSNTMYRATVQTFPAASGLAPSLLVNHVVNAGGGVHGVRWAHIQLDPQDTLFDGGFEAFEANEFGAKLIDDGVFAPDSDSRWMGAISMDQSGNIGLGYMVSSTTLDPTIRYTGREPGDAPHSMRTEQVCVDGGGQQTVDSRWGDYSTTSIDPTDQCTFWHYNEYNTATSVANWSTRVCSFRFPSCGQASLIARAVEVNGASVCTANGDPQFKFALHPLNGLTGSVSLAGSNLPAGATAVFPLNPVPNNQLPNDQVVVTLQNAVALAAGDYSFNVVATPNSGSAQTVAIDFSLADAAPGAPVLQAPSNGGGSSIRPTLTWDAVPGAQAYRVEVSDTADFSNILQAAMVSTPSYVTDPLAAEQTFFWRVAAVNSCGSVLSSVFSFDTVTPGTCPAGTSPAIAFNEDFESGAAGWTQPADPTGGGNTWAQSNVRQNSGAFSFLAVDSPAISDQYLVSPPINVPGLAQQPITLSFWNFQNFEADVGTGINACWDAGILEVSTDGGINFTQVEDGSLFTDPYNGGIRGDSSNPLSFLNGWCADDAQPASGSQEAVSIVNMNQFAGQTVQLRFRVGTDLNTGDEGWYIDDVEVQGCN